MGKMMPCLPAQLRLLEAVQRLVAFVAGYGAGKTHSAALKALQLAMANPGCEGAFVEPTYKMCKNIAAPMLSRMCKAMGIVYDFKQADMQFWVFVGNDEPEWTCIHLLTAKKPEGIDGLTLAWAIVDEAGQCEEVVAKKLLGRLREPRARQIQLILCGTPEGGPGTWFGQWAEFGPKKMRADLLIRARTADNPHLPPSYLQRMRDSYTELEFRGYCEGYFVAAGGQVYRYVADKHQVRFEMDDTVPGRVEVWADFNVTKVVWLLAFISKDRVHVFDEIVSLNTYTDEQANKTRERLIRWGVHPDKIVCVHDANTSLKQTTTSGKPGKSDVAMLKEAGFKPKSRNQNPAVRDRIASVNTKLKNGTLVVDERCVELCKSLATQGRTEKGEPDKSGGLDHAVDALGYGVHMHWPVKHKPPNAGQKQNYY